MRKSSRRVLLAALLVTGVLAGLSWHSRGLISSYVSPTPPGAGSAGARAWAVRVDAPPLTNFYRVSDSLYRGAQPDAAGMAKLKALGINTVVNLRNAHSDRDAIGSLGLKAVHIDVNTFAPETEDVAEFLRVACDPDNAPVFVHCRRGIDRTGMMVAAYRMVACGWTKDEAIEEMTEGPYGYDKVFRNVVEAVRRLDVEELKRQARAGGKTARP